MEKEQEKPENRHLIADYLTELEPDIEEQKRLSGKKASNRLLILAVVLLLPLIRVWAGGRTAFVSGRVVVLLLIQSGIIATLSLWAKQHSYRALLAGLAVFYLFQLILIANHSYLAGIDSVWEAFRFNFFLMLALPFLWSRDLKNAQELHTTGKRTF